MTTRSLRFVGPREVRVDECGVPEPGPDEVRVETAVSAISPGTELLIYRGNAPTELPTDETIAALSGELDYPLAYGYAAVGDVTAVGDRVADDWLDATVFAFHPHEETFVADPADLMCVPETCQRDAAAFLPNVESAVNFVMDGQPMVGERVVVFGQGVVGLLTTAVLSSFPLERLVAVEPCENRRDAALALGADDCVPPDAVGSLFDGGADLAFEASGNPAALDDALSVTGYDGRVVIGSWYGRKRVDLDLGGEFHRSRIELESSQVSTIDPSLRGRWDKDRRLDVAWQQIADLDVDPLVTHRFPVGRAADAYELLDEHPCEAVGVLLTYGQ
jgi:2-desacetyl-2-hydroxyethyl bacteriochlorophyllide A dehydrogenase